MIAQPLEDIRTAKDRIPTSETDEERGSHYMHDSGPSGAHTNRAYRAKGGNLSMRPQGKNANNPPFQHISSLQKSRKRK